MFSIEFNETAMEDLSRWRKSGDKRTQEKITSLLKDIQEHPETGIGKPELLRKNLTGFWSRRINLEHRIVYKIFEDKQKVVVYSLYGHY